MTIARPDSICPAALLSMRQMLPYNDLLLCAHGLENGYADNSALSRSWSIKSSAVMPPSAVYHTAGWAR